MNARLADSGGKSAEELEAEASAWAAKLDAAPDPACPGLEEWLAQSPKHAGALLRAQAVLAVFAPVVCIEEPPARRRAAPSLVPIWKRLTIAGGGAAALAASLAAILLAGPARERYETGAGEVRSVVLSDGSSVVIDAKSRITIGFDAQHRDVHLYPGSKALFQVAHNAARPFRVVMRHITITDVGTIFQVANDDSSGNIEVLVAEGAVQVDSPAGRVNLVAGQRARFPPMAAHGHPPEPVRITTADIDRALAWREDRLELDGETLDSAIAEVNRHSRIPLRVNSAALGKESLYGSFRMDDPAGFARAAAISLRAEAHTEPDGIVIGAREK